MKGPLNPPLEVGDRIMCYHMEGETSVPPGTFGTVTKISPDPFEVRGEEIISVKWDNGSQLNLITSTDAWKKVKKDNVNEERSQESSWSFITQNPEVFENFDWKWIREFLYKIRKSGIINMFGASPLLYAGKEHIDRYYGEGLEDDENFQEVLNDADESKNKIIQGVLKYMEKNNKDTSDMGLVNRYAQNFANKLVGVYIAFSKYKGNEN